MLIGEDGSCAHRSSRRITVGPLFSRMASSECTPTNSSLPSCRACSMAPAWPVLYCKRYICRMRKSAYRGEQSRNSHRPICAAPKLQRLLEGPRATVPRWESTLPMFRQLFAWAWAWRARTRALCLRCIVTWGSWRGFAQQQ